MAKPESQTTLKSLVKDIQRASPDALDLVLKINAVAGEIEAMARALVAHFPVDLRPIVLDAVARRLMAKP